MKTKTIDKYQVGDECFRYVDMGGVFRYIVTGIRTYADEIQLEAECQTCSHGFKCRVLLARDDSHRIIVVHMLNEDEERPQHYWHTNDGLYFWPTAHEAKQEGYRFILRRREESVNKMKDQLAQAVKARDELAALIEPEKKP